MKLLVRMILLGIFAGGVYSQTQNLAAARGQTGGTPDASGPADTKNKGALAQVSQTAPKLDEIIDRMIKREHDAIAAFDLYRPIVETYIQVVRPDKLMGIVPRSDFYFLGQADFRRRLKVRSLIERTRKVSLWSFEPAGFLQMIFIDRGEFDRAHYKFSYSGREFLGEVRCYVFDVTPAPKVRGARFVGRIWVEDQDFNVVRINGRYSPAIHFSLKTFENEYYLHFDSWRTNVKSGMWLPSYVYRQELERPTRFGKPSYKSSTHLWGYKLKQGSREEECLTKKKQMRLRGSNSNSGAYRRDAELVPDNWCHDGAEDLYGVQHFLVRKRRDTHLERDAGDAAENFIHIKDLFRDRFSVADQQRAGRSAQGVVLSACGGWPAAFLTDFGKGVRIAWKEYFRGFLRASCEKANGMKTYSKSLRGMTGAAPGLAVEVYEWAEASRLAADYCHHKRKSEHACANERFRSAADSDPYGQRFLQRARVDCLAGKSRAVFAGPVHLRACPDF